MSYTVDANVLLYATDQSSPMHTKAQELVGRLTGGPQIAYLFWPVLMSYLRMATHPSIFSNPLSPDEAMRNVDGLVSLRHVRTPGEEVGIWETYRSVGEGVRGNLVPDAHLVALMHQHGVATIWSQDRDFRRFDGIQVRSLDDVARFTG